jgi:hypothetical protein
MDQQQQLIAEMEANLLKLKAAAVPVAVAPIPATVPIPAFNLQEAVRAEMAKYTQPPSIQWKDVFTALAKKSLDTEQFEWLQRHIASGAPGAIQFVDSPEMVALMQMTMTEYREFLARPPKASPG